MYNKYISFSVFSVENVNLITLTQYFDKGCPNICKCT